MFLKPTLGRRMGTTRFFEELTARHDNVLNTNIENMMKRKLTSPILEGGF